MADAAAQLWVQLRGEIGDLQQKMSSAVGVLTSTESKINSITSNISKAISAAFVVAGVNAVKNFGESIVDLGQKLGELAEKGDELGDIETNFKKLGGSSSAIDAAKKSVLGAVDAFDLMKVANDGLIRGIPNLNQNFAKLSEFAGRFAEAKGRNMVDVLQQMMEAISKAKNKPLLEFGIAIEDGGTKVERMDKIIQQFIAHTPDFAAVVDSAGQAFSALKVEIGEAEGKFAIGVDSSDKLRESYRQLAEQISKIDWKTLGHDIAEAAGAIAQLLAAMDITKITAFVSQLAYAISHLKEFSVQSDLAEAKSNLSSLDSIWGGKPLATAMGMGGPATEVWQAKRDAALKRVTELQNQATTSAISGLLDVVKSKGILGPRESGAATGGVVGAVGTAAGESGKKVDELKQKLVELGNAAQSKSISSALTDAVKNLDSVNFNKLTSELAEATREGYLEGHKEFLTSGIPGAKEKIIQLADEAASSAVDDWQQKFSDASGKQMQELQKQSEEAYKNSIATWTGLFENAITGATFDLESALKQVAVGFAAEMANAIFGSLGNITSPQGLGGFLAQSILGSAGGAGGGAGGLLGSLLGGAGGAGIGSALFGTTAASAQAAGIAGPAMANGMFSPGLLSNPYVIGGVVAAVGTYMAARHFGVFGSKPTNPDTIARDKVESHLETTLGQNFVFGSSSKFNNGQGFEYLNKLDAKSKSTFLGMGEALRQTLKITEDIGPQIGAILAENLGGSADKARHMFKQLGFSLEDITDAIVAMGMKGEKTWHEIEVMLQGVEAAAQPGLQAMGDYAAAFDNLIKSGGKGFEAVQSVRDIAIEALEKNLQNFEQLRAALQVKFKPEEVNAFFQALSQRGVTSLSQLKDVSDRVAGGIVADMESLGVKFQDGANAVQTATSQIAALGNAAENTAGKLGSKVSISSSEPTGDEGETAFAMGGIIGKPTRALMGENGPEAVLPLTRRNGRLGVSLHGQRSSGMGTVINIDARGADAAVDHKLRMMTLELEERLVRRFARSFRDR